MKQTIALVLALLTSFSAYSQTPVFTASNETQLSETQKAEKELAEDNLGEAGNALTSELDNFSAPEGGPADPKVTADEPVIRTPYFKRKSPYQLSYAKEIPIIAHSLGAFIATPFMMKKKVALDPSKVQNNVWKWERNTYMNNCKGAGTASDILLYASTAAPFLLIADKSIRNDYKTFVMYAEVMAITLSTTGFVKSIANRSRPYVYNPDTPADRINTINSSESFLSGHTSTTAASCFFIATVYAHHHPNSKLKPYLWTGAAVIPAVVGGLRVASGNHFTTDVLAGYILGAATGMLVPTIHKIKADKSKKATLQEQKKL